MQATSSDFSRSRPTKKRYLAAPLIFVVLSGAGAHSLAANSIEELLHQDQVESQNDGLRPDLNALTEAQWDYYFTVGRVQTRGMLENQAIENQSDHRSNVLYIWLAAIAAGLGMAAGATKAWPAVRREVGNWVVPVRMENPGITLPSYGWYEDGKSWPRVH